MSIVQRALALGRKAHAGMWEVEVTYRPHDGSPQYTTKLVPAIVSTKAMDEDGITMDVHMRDWICELENLSRFPERGDLILWEGKRYRVEHPGATRDTEWHDPYEESVRIHTVRVSEEEQVTGVPYGDFRDGPYKNPDNVDYEPPQ